MCIRDSERSVGDQQLLQSTTQASMGSPVDIVISQLQCNPATPLLTAWQESNNDGCGWRSFHTLAS
eukprot:7926490-Lingulodinium_polyedra.AAC.1